MISLPRSHSLGHSSIPRPWPPEGSSTTVKSSSRSRRSSSRVGGCGGIVTRMRSLGMGFRSAKTSVNQYFSRHAHELAAAEDERELPLGLVGETDAQARRLRRVDVTVAHHERVADDL